MMRRLSWLGVLFVFLALSLPTWGTAATVTFMNPSQQLVSSHTEDGMAYAAGPDYAFLISASQGNPPSGVWGSPLGNGPGLVFTRDGGGLFTFDEVDYAAISSSSDTTEFVGYRNGNQQFSFQLNAPTSTFNAYVTNQTANIDELVLEVVAGSSSALVLDNFDFTFIPEPTSLLLLAVGGLLTVCRRRSRG